MYGSQAEECRDVLVLSTLVNPALAGAGNDIAKQNALPPLPDPFPDLVGVYATRLVGLGCTNSMDCGMQSLTKKMLVYPLPGLCVTSGPQSGSWSADRGWLVLSARLAGEHQEGLYALRTGWGDAVENRRFPAWTVLELVRFGGQAPQAQVRPRP